MEFSEFENFWKAQKFGVETNLAVKRATGPSYSHDDNNIIFTISQGTSSQEDLPVINMNSVEGRNLLTRELVNSSGYGGAFRDKLLTLSEEDYNKPIEFILKRRDNKFIAEYKGDIKEGDCTNLCDYSFSMLWIGAANRIVEDHNHVFIGDIDILHLQESYLDDEYCKLFFSDFDKFLPIAKNPENIPIYTGDFKDTTPYRIMDLSENGNHPIIFRKEWMM